MRRLLLVVLLLAACSSAPPVASPTLPGTTPPGSTPVGTTPPTAPPTDPAPTSPSADWRVLAEDLWLGDSPFAVAAAFSSDELQTLWAQLNRTEPQPDVDFSREAVLFLGMAGSSSCPEQLTRLVVDEGAGRVYGEWFQQVPPGGACTDDLAAQGGLIAVPGDVLPDEPFILSLRRERVCPECPDQVLVDPTGR
jgi:hypothetical protein